MRTAHHVGRQLRRRLSACTLYMSWKGWEFPKTTPYIDGKNERVAETSEAIKPAIQAVIRTEKMRVSRVSGTTPYMSGKRK